MDPGGTFSSRNLNIPLVLAFSAIPFWVHGSGVPLVWAFLGVPKFGAKMANLMVMEFFTSKMAITTLVDFLKD